MEKNKMKIVFISYSYLHGWTYQDNLLVTTCIEEGHDVLCLASNICSDEYGALKIMGHLNDPPYVKRLKTIFSSFIPLCIRVRYLKGLYVALEAFAPEVIFLTSVQTLNLITLARYKRKHPNVLIYYNSHTDYYTSATNWLSMNILHKLIYKMLIKRYLYVAEKFFYISVNTGKFLKEVYAIPEEMTELMLLGGHVQRPQQLSDDREAVMKQLFLEGEKIIFLQAGKMDKQKCLIETLKCFSETDDSRFVLLIVGSIDDSIRLEADLFINGDSRIFYMGWEDDGGLIRYLNSADVYIQPGKVSVILETALCCSCAVVARDFDDYRLLVSDNGWLIKSLVSELPDAFTTQPHHSESYQSSKSKNIKNKQDEGCSFFERKFI